MTHWRPPWPGRRPAAPRAWRAGPKGHGRALPTAPPRSRRQAPARDRRPCDPARRRRRPLIGDPPGSHQAAQTVSDPLQPCDDGTGMDMPETAEGRLQVRVLCQRRQAFRGGPRFNICTSGVRPAVTGCGGENLWAVLPDRAGVGAVGRALVLIILRNIVLVGCRTFNEIADGAPGLSRGLLSKRLRDLERAGVIEIRPKPDGPGSIYEPTQAGRELSEVMLALQPWGSQWAELTPEHAHPGVVLWGWVTCHLDRGRLPRRRVVVRFDYPTLSGPGSRAWLLIERGDAEICEKHPGGEEDLVVVVSDPVAFARWDLGELEWSDAVRGGAIEVRGSRALARALPTWKRRVDPVRRPPAVRQAATLA